MMPSNSSAQFEVPRWQYEAWRRWFLPSDEARESREIKADAERQAGER